jgi:hypothetical protein
MDLARLPSVCYCFGHMKTLLVIITASLLAGCAVTYDTPPARENYIYARPSQPDTVLVY